MPTASSNELLAVHEELLMLIRAGLPLDRGLKEFARDVPGRMNPLISELANRLAQGHEPAAALAGISPEARIYAAVLAVGMRSGRPAAALEGIVSTARRAQSFHRAMLVELVYPLLVLIVGTALIVFSLLNIAPTNVAVSEGFDASGPLIDGIKSLSMQSSIVMILLVSAALLLALWLVPRLVSTSPLNRSGRWRPWQQIRTWQSLSTLLDHLALLVEHQVPLAEALALASEAIAWPPLARAVQLLAQRVARGETRLTVEPPLPPVVGWLLQSPGGKLPQALRREAEHFRRRSDRQQRWFSLYFPVLATLLVGGLCLIVLVFINLAPLVNLYYQLSAPQP
jgi:general secretion pathway protein F